jgi:hypothetical protein
MDYSCATRPATPASLQRDISTPINTVHDANTVDLSRLQLSNSGCLPGRKGRRRFNLLGISHCHSKSKSLPESSGKKQWPCTFCLQPLRCRWEWKRHEVTHLPPTWFCMLNNSPIVEGSCGLCGESDVQPSHLGTHLNVEACMNKPVVERGFSRKDKLQDHIRRVHLKEDSSCPFKKLGRLLSNSLLDSWHKEDNLSISKPVALWCGFCMISLRNWNERVEHVGDHLQSGLCMEKWRSAS